MRTLENKEMTIKFGLFGLEQHVGVILGGVEANPDLVEFVAVGSPYRKDDGRLRELSRRYGALIYEDYRDMLADGVEVLGLCTVNNEKAQVIIECIRRGVHVVTDKPLCIEMDELEAIEKALTVKKGVAISMLLTLRGSPAYIEVKRIVDKGKIGKPISIYARRAFALRPASRPKWLFDWRRSGGIIVELAVHDVDYARWLVNESVEEVRAYHGKARQEFTGEYQDHAEVLMRFENGTVAFIEANRLVPERVRSDCMLRVTGSKGTVKIEDGEVILLTEGFKGEVRDLPEPVNVFVDFVEALKTGRRPLVPTEDVLEATRITLEARASAMTQSVGSTV